MQGTFAALWGTHHLMHMLWGKLVVSMGPSLVSTSMGAAVAALNFGLNFAISQVISTSTARHLVVSRVLSNTSTSMRSLTAAFHFCVDQVPQFYCLLGVKLNVNGSAWPWSSTVFCGCAQG